MKQAFYTVRGAAREVLRIEDAPSPAPGPGEVAIRIHASGVNPSDVKTRFRQTGQLHEAAQKRCQQRSTDGTTSLSTRS